ncbi:MAG TPA: pitrilysin family protein [Mycobacteriales bacterium]|nr:pitrilysin family protein [Mycobacteriales bacterium]
MTLISERPVIGTPRPWSFPSFERRTVAGGRVIACHLPGRPLAVTALVLDAGASSEPLGGAGVAELVARALSEGTANRDAYAFAVAGERLGATWRASTDWDSLRCGFEVPVGDISGATALLAEAVDEAAFADDTLSRIRDERIDEIGLEMSQPSARAGEAMSAEVFADVSRYHRSDAGDVASLTAITDADIRAFRAARLTRSAATLVLVGDLSAVDVEALGHAVFEGWAQGSGEPAAPDVSLRRSGRRVVVVDRPGSVQSMLLVGHDGPPRKVEDYVAMTTMSLVLGGMFSSRLNLKLREEKGYAYGAFGGFDTRRHGGLFLTRAAVQSDVTIPALADLVAEIERMHAGGVEPAELEQARAYRAGVFPINFAGVMAVASGLGDLVINDFADDHFDALRARVLDVGKDELDASAASHLRPDDLVTVVVGDASGFASELESAGLGPVTIVPDEQ